MSTREKFGEKFSALSSQLPDSVMIMLFQVGSIARQLAQAACHQSNAHIKWEES